MNNTDESYCDLLVDCGVTTHILNNDSKFINFYKNFDPSRYVVELADGSKYNNLPLKRGDSSVKMTVAEGISYFCLARSLIRPLESMHNFTQSG